jgi:hypothetical protein
MRSVLLGVAASLTAVMIPATPAQARDAVGIGIPNAKSAPVPGAQPSFRGDFRCDVRDRDRDRDRRDGRRDRRSRDDCVFVGGNLGYLDYGDYDANRSFDPDLWNDWWHERPSRAYPRWVQEAHVRGTCEPDRMWWSGGGWHC